MKINIDGLSEAELLDLNHRIVARLKFMREARSHQAMLEFRVGERVSFQPEGREPLFGMLTRYNRKSVTVITEDGGHWTVAPQFLRKVVQAGAASNDTTEIIELSASPPPAAPPPAER